MRKVYKNRRNTLVSLLRGCEVSQLLTILEQDAGLHFLLKADTRYSDRELTERLEGLGIRVRALSDYYHDTTPRTGYLVINYSGVKEESMRQALEKICEIM